MVMNNRRLSPSKKITLGAMVSALTLLCLYAVAVLPGGRAIFYFLSSVFVYALCCEGAYATALLSFAATAGLSFLLLPDKTVAVAYALLLGHYGIFKTGLDLSLIHIYFNPIRRMKTARPLLRMAQLESKA